MRAVRVHLHDMGKPLVYGPSKTFDIGKSKPFFCRPVNHRNQLVVTSQLVRKFAGSVRRVIVDYGQVDVWHGQKQLFNRVL